MIQTLIQDIDRYGAAAESHAGIVVFHAEGDAVAEVGSAGIFGPGYAIAGDEDGRTQGDDVGVDGDDAIAGPRPHAGDALACL